MASGDSAPVLGDVESGLATLRGGLQILGTKIATLRRGLRSGAMTSRDTSRRSSETSDMCRDASRRSSKTSDDVSRYIAEVVGVVGEPMCRAMDRIYAFLRGSGQGSEEPDR